MPFAVAAHRIALENPLVQFDPDTRDFIMRVERADGQAMEARTRQALDAFVRGCKADGIWDAIKACCVMMGARTLAGALVPLKGAAPTNFNFVSGDYNRKTGLVGNGTTKYLDSNRNNNADPRNSNHNSVYVSGGTGGTLMGTNVTVNGANHIDTSGVNLRYHNRNNAFVLGANFVFPALTGSSRSASASFSYLFNGAVFDSAQVSQAPENNNILLFARNPASPTSFCNRRLSFYSIGEALNLALLNARVTALSNAISTAF